MTKPELRTEGLGEKITRDDVEDWAENYRKAIDVLMWFIEKDYTKEDLIKSIQLYRRKLYVAEALIILDIPETDSNGENEKDD